MSDDAAPKEEEPELRPSRTRTSRTSRRATRCRSHGRRPGSRAAAPRPTRGRRRERRQTPTTPKTPNESEASDDDAGTSTDSDTDSDGDENAWAAADGLDGDHRALRVQGLAWDGIPQNRRRRVWLELSGARARAGDPTVPPPELRKTTEELENIVGSRIAADVKLDCGRGGGRTNSRERLVLRRVLLAVAAKFPETGYAQGLNVVAQTLLESIGDDESIIFWLLAELVDGD